MIKNSLTIFFSYLILVFFSGSLCGQTTNELRGTIVDNHTGEPVPYANISIKNKPSGTTSNELGRFKTTNDLTKNITLVFSHVNYKKKELTIGSANATEALIIRLEPKSIQLSDVIVTAGLYEQRLDKLAQSVELIEHRQVMDEISSNITDVLASKPGFTQVWEYHSPIILRGLNSNRLIVMKDGNRRIGTFPGGYFGQDMNIYDMRKIEVIKGPGSVIYGSGAISGIINVISNEPFGDNRNSIQLHSGFGTNNNEFIEMVKVCHKKEDFGISVNAKYRKTDEMVYGNGQTADNSNVEDRDIAINTGYKFSDKHKVIVNANYHWGNWGKPRGFNGPTKKFTKIRNEEGNIHTDINYTYSPRRFVESVSLNLYYDDGWRDYFQYKYSTVSGNVSTLDLVHYKNQYGGGRLFTILNLCKTNKLTIGTDGYLFRLSSPSEIFDYYNNIHGEVKGAKNAGQQDVGAFINDEWLMGKKVKLISGIRFDLATVITGVQDSLGNSEQQRTALSGNTGLVYSPTENMHFSINVGRAFRMPTTEELFSKTISCQGIKMGNAKLNPEYGWNFDIGFRGKALDRKFKYDLALFHNILDGFIRMAASQEEGIDFTFENSDALLTGGELSTSYQFRNVLQPSNVLFIGLGAAYVHGVDLSGSKQVPLFGMPPLKITAELNYKGLLNKKWITGYVLKINTEYAAEQNRVATIPEGTDGGPWGYVKSNKHSIVNFSVGLNSNSLPSYPKIRVVVKNILNSNYQPFGSYIPAMGRNIKILLSLHF